MANTILKFHLELNYGRLWAFSTFSGPCRLEPFRDLTWIKFNVRGWSQQDLQTRQLTSIKLMLPFSKTRINRIFSQNSLNELSFTKLFDYIQHVPELQLHSAQRNPECSFIEWGTKYFKMWDPLIDTFKFFKNASRECYDINYTQN